MRYNVTILTRKEEEAIGVIADFLDRITSKPENVCDAAKTLVALKEKSLNNRRK
jgi:hypothetical protein